MAKHIGLMVEENRPPVTVTVAVDVSADAIDSLLISAVESSCGIGYWASVSNCDPSLAYRGMIVRECNGPQRVMVMDDATILRGLNVMAAKYGMHFADITRDNADARTADVLFQCAMFGELVYG